MRRARLALPEGCADEDARREVVHPLSILAVAPSVLSIVSTGLAADSGYSAEGPAWADVMLIPTALLIVQASIIVGSAVVNAARAAERLPVIWLPAAAVGVGVIAAVVEPGLVPTVVMSTGLLISALIATFARRTFISTSVA